MSGYDLSQYLAFALFVAIVIVGLSVLIAGWLTMASAFWMLA